MGFLPLFSSNLFKEDMIIKYENCLYQMSNFKFTIQHSRRKSGVAAGVVVFITVLFFVLRATPWLARGYDYCFVFCLR